MEGDGKFRLGAVKSARFLWVFLAAGAAFGLIWYYHFSDIGAAAGRGRVAAAAALDNHKFVCNVLLDGFLRREQDSWGSSVKKEEVLFNWERYRCKEHIMSCDKMAAARGPREHDVLFEVIWRELGCEGDFRPAAKAAAPKVVTWGQVKETVPPSPSPAPKLVPSPSTMLAAELSIPSPSSMLSLSEKSIPSPSTMLEASQSIPSPTAMLAAAVVSSSSPSSASPSATPTLATPSPTAPTPPKSQDLRAKYDIRPVPPPANYSEEELHWCTSARDKHKVWPNETHVLAKVLRKFDTAVPPAARSYHDRWKALNCAVVCAAADQWEQDKERLYIKLIASLPSSKEKRVISFSLYGTNPKYVDGALRNAELVPTYFPGWVCRFYVSGLPQRITDRLKALGSEVYPMTGYGNMLSRFLVAADPSVDRYIVRDTDSRLNQRDRLAVEEWIDSGKAIHSIRDHINHCHPLMGGMWGGIKGAIPGFENRVKALMQSPLAKEYMTDMHFLRNQIWPLVQNKVFQHDTYCCKSFPGSVSMPTRRPLNYLHVGQIFDEFERPVMSHIEGHIRDLPNAPLCRHRAHPDWLYG